MQFKKIAEVSSSGQFTPEKYIACVYDDECYMAVIREYSLKIVILEYNLWKGMAYFYTGLKRIVETNVGYISRTKLLMFRYLHHMVAVQGNAT